MSKKLDGLSRRKLLGGLGTMGAAGILGGTATSALLWDEEKFGNSSDPNVLQGGRLDLKVDWEEHYVDWIGSETDVDGVRMVESAADLMADEAGLPTDENPMVAVKTGDTDGDEVSQLDEFMEATIVEESDMTDQPDPVVTIEDVKPGDFGEVTLSYHVLGNPGFVSLCGEVHADVDNGINEAEDKVNGHDPDDSDGTEGGDLGDHIQATAWYDPDCDNLFDGGEVEVMVMTDVSESVASELPGTPGLIDDNDGDATILEGIKGIVGDYNGSGFLTDLAASCGDNVEIGSVSASEDLYHLDNLEDGDDADSPAGRDDGGLDANLDKALGKAGGADYDELKTLYAQGTDASPDFITDDPINNDDFDGTNSTDTYEAERGYLENGDSRQISGVRRAHRALLPDDYDNTGGGGRSGIDPSGNAAEPGQARKILVPLVDGGFSAEQDPIDTATTLRQKAAADDIEIHPVVINAIPGKGDVEFAEELASQDVDPIFATRYDGSPSDCDDDVEAAGFSCVSLQAAMDTIHSRICASAGGEEVLAGPASIKEVISSLDDCQLMDPAASGSAVSEEFGGLCHSTDQQGCVALAWWLPRDIPGVNDNIIQTDRFEFQLSFEAVQCRHNTTEEGMPMATLPEADEENNAQHHD